MKDGMRLSEFIITDECKIPPGVVKIDRLIITTAHPGTLKDISVGTLIVRGVKGFESQIFDCFQPAHDYWDEEVCDMPIDTIHIEDGYLGWPIKAKKYIYDTLSNYLRDGKTWHKVVNLPKDVEFAFEENDLLEKTTNSIKVPNDISLVYISHLSESIESKIKNLKPNLIIDSDNAEVYVSPIYYFNELRFKSMPKCIRWGYYGGAFSSIWVGENLICAINSGDDRQMCIVRVDRLEDLYIFTDPARFLKVYVGGKVLGNVFNYPDLKFPEGRSLPLPYRWKKAVIYPTNCGSTAPLAYCEEIVLAEGIEKIEMKTDMQLGAKRKGKYVSAPRYFDDRVFGVHNLSIPGSFKMDISKVIGYFPALTKLEISTDLTHKSVYSDGVNGDFLIDGLVIKIPCYTHDIEEDLSGSGFLKIVFSISKNGNMGGAATNMMREQKNYGNFRLKEEKRLGEYTLL